MTEKHPRQGDWVRSTCDNCGAAGLWVKLKETGAPQVWLPALCADCLTRHDEIKASIEWRCSCGGTAWPVGARVCRECGKEAP